MITAVADTHAILWYLFADARLSPAAKAVLDGRGHDRVAISGVTLVEILYLIEKRRISPVSMKGVRDLLHQPDARLIEIPLDHRIVDAMALLPREQVPDMPDRVIAGTALFLNVPLVSRDGRIRASAITTIW